MATNPTFAVIPVSVAVAGTPEDILEAVEINRAPNPDGAQDDHSSAFALLKQALLSQLKLYRTDDGVHITPVFTSLFEMAKRENEIYTHYVKSQKLLEELNKIYAEVCKIQNHEPLESSTGVPIIEKINVALAKIVDNLKKTPVKSRKPALLKQFFTVWGRIIPYLELNELQKNLLQEIPKADVLMKKYKQDASKYAHTALPVKPDEVPKEREEVLNLLINAYLYSARINAFRPAMLESIANTFAQFLNKLPFATFKKAPIQIRSAICNFIA